MGCGASTVAPTADAGGGTSLTRQLTAAIDRTSKSTRVSTLQREAIEEADALLRTSCGSSGRIWARASSTR
jgi:hypothetical protein